MSFPYHSLTITAIKEEVPGVKTFSFAAEDAAAISYEPGQYLTLIAHHLQEEVRRSYSIVSSPVLGEPLTIGVKRLENGFFSRLLVDKAQVGDKVFTIGAAGLFTLPVNLTTYRQIFFWAAGSGITPIISLIKTVLHQFPAIDVVLVYSNHAPQSTVFLPELTELAEQFPHTFHLHLLYSVNTRLEEARLHKDLFKKLVSRYSIASPAQILCYVCGSENYRRLCLYGLRELGVPAENIRLETFSTGKVTNPALPPDTERHPIQIYYKGDKHSFTSQYPFTILQAAKNAGLSLPYSCEAGRCGNCVAKCLKGSVWMSYNEVLTKKDEAQGLVLTCVGYPIGGEVVLEIK